MKKYFPIFIFISFTALLIIATIFYAPSWGLMDAAPLQSASHVWSGNAPVREAAYIIFHNAYFMPFYDIWALLTYHLFRNSPLVCYIIIILQNMLGVFLWGLVLHKVFSDKKRNLLLNTCVFSLTLFLFTPFWNIFSYINLQEKFIFLFGVLSMYFMKKYLDTERARYFLVSLLFIILAIFNKPQGIHIALVYIIYSCFLLLIKDKRRTAILILITHFILLAGYSLFTVKYQLNGYASRYTLSLISMTGNFRNVPFIIKLSLIAAVFMAFYIIHKVIKQNKFSLEAVFIPLGLVCYIVVLLPWGILIYHISVAAPYVLGMVFPCYSYFNERSRITRLVVNCLIIFLIILTYMYIITPRISKAADIKKTVIFLKDSSNQQVGSRYFFPPPFVESAYSLSFYTSLKITYVQSGVLSGNMLGDGVKNFLIVDDQDPSIDLSGVGIGKEVYRNDTWKVYEIKKNQDGRTKFVTIFKENIFQRLKTYLRR